MLINEEYMNINNSSECASETLVPLSIAMNNNNLDNHNLSSSAAANTDNMHVSMNFAPPCRVLSQHLLEEL